LKKDLDFSHQQTSVHVNNVLNSTQKGRQIRVQSVNSIFCFDLFKDRKNKNKKSPPHIPMKTEKITLGNGNLHSFPHCGRNIG
jgi:hypothetical protein